MNAVLKHFGKAQKTVTLCPLASLHTTSTLSEGRARRPFFNKHKKVTDPAKQDPEYFEKKAAALPLDNHYIDALQMLWTEKISTERDVMMKGADNLIGNKTDYGLPNIDKTAPRLEYANVDELKDAPEAVKKIFSIDFGERKDLTNAYKRCMIDSVNNHSLDNTSYQVRIGWATATIRQWTALVDSLMDGNPKKPTWLTHRLFLMINYRRKLLRLLREQDEAEFERVISELKIAYHIQKQPEHVKTRKAWSEHQLKIRVTNEKERKMTELHHSLMEAREAKVNKIENSLAELAKEEQAIQKKLLEIKITEGKTVANVAGKYQPKLIEELSETVIHSLLFGFPKPTMGQKSQSH
uniref:28S ribosomal protein S15, mitochondrial n=1 Tax=Rhabditophanes sp. KR3021 TaxID=114890 RepID=A0AC35U087_9BILA